jgi:hypothetical protein
MIYQLTVAHGVADAPTWVQVANPGDTPLVFRNRSHVCYFHCREEWETETALIDESADQHETDSLKTKQQESTVEKEINTSELGETNSSLWVPLNEKEIETNSSLRVPLNEKRLDSEQRFVPQKQDPHNTISQLNFGSLLVEHTQVSSTLSEPHSSRFPLGENTQETDSSLRSPRDDKTEQRADSSSWVPRNEIRESSVLRVSLLDRLPTASESSVLRVSLLERQAAREASVLWVPLLDSQAEIGASVLRVPLLESQTDNQTSVLWVPLLESEQTSSVLRIPLLEKRSETVGRRTLPEQVVNQELTVIGKIGLGTRPNRTKAPDTEMRGDDGISNAPV